MTLVLSVASLRGIDLAELQLNSPTCPVAYNSTHLTAIISLTGCGTEAVVTCAASSSALLPFPSSI